MLLVLLGPGVLLHALLSPRARAVELPLQAAAAWAIAFWWLRLLPVGWVVPVALLGGAAFCAGILSWKRLPDLPSVLVWLAAAALFAVLARGALVPPGVDAAMHAAVARILADSHGHPAGFRPLWPIDSFASFPVGQPVLTALLAELGALGWRQAALAGNALAYALVLVAFAAAVSRWGGGSALGLAAGVAAVLAARAPLYFWTWGGAPNALGIAFAVAAFAAGLDAVRAPDPHSAASCALFSAAGLVTHAISVAALAYAALPLLLGAVLLRPQIRRGLPWLVGAGMAAVALCVPYLLTLRPPDPGGVAWIHAWLRESASLRIAPRMLHDVPLLAGGAALIAVLATRPSRAALPAALAAALALLVLQGRFALLPGSVLLYPDRIAVLLLYPVAQLAHDALSRKLRLAAVCAAALIVHAAVLQAKLLREGRAHALASEADLRVLEAAALPKDCWVLTNYGDAGQWIPALLAQPVTYPHIHVAFFGLSARVHPCAAFRGAKRPYGPDTVPCPGRACEPWLRDGGAELFRITDPALLVDLSPER